jgi:hypothetical protein
VKPNVGAPPPHEDTRGRGVCSKADVLGAHNGRGVSSGCDLIASAGLDLVGVEGARERAYDISSWSASGGISCTVNCSCDDGVGGDGALSI